MPMKVQGQKKKDVNHMINSVHLRSTDELNRTKKKPPGILVRIISFIPVFNWIALIILGKRCVHKISMISGIGYGILTFAVPDAAFYIWIAVMIQYAVTRRNIGKKHMSEISFGKEGEKDELKERKADVIFSDVVIDGAKEGKQLIPKKPVKWENSEEIPPRQGANISFEYEIPGRNYSDKEVNIDISYEYSSKGKFMRDMRKFADKSGKKVPFVPFMSYWPTYDTMDQFQKAWYFYWRTEVRNGNYIDTDLSYIFIYVYELLSGIGWKDTQEGYDRLMTLWMQYRERYPKLDHYLFAWTFDFAWLHNLAYIGPTDNSVQLPYQQTIKDVLIDKHSKDRPLKLSFALIDSLCDYSLTGSKFYKDGHQLLIQEAIPRVIALVDASFIKKENQGILSLYAPAREKRQSYFLFQSAVCPDANKRIDISVKAYTSSQRLRGFINEIVRFAENTLRAMYGCRGRLRGVVVEEKTAALIEGFLKKEYSPVVKDEDRLAKKEIKLDFGSINELRNQSDAVRDALEVSDSREEPKELLTDLEEVKSLLGVLSPDGRMLIDELAKNQWEDANDSDKTRLVEEINIQANKYLACALLVLEQGSIVVEDDYRDELDYIYTNQIEIRGIEEKAAETADLFMVEKLSDKMRQVVDNLNVAQTEVLYAILVKESIHEKLVKAAEELMSMPEIIIDEINDIATQYIDDILIDTFGDEPYVFEQYEEELKQAIK